MQKRRRTGSNTNSFQAFSGKPEFTAAVRYCNGRTELFRVKNADNLEDARAVVLAELDGVRSLVIAPRP
jgi:predicted transcriptional regulator